MNRLFLSLALRQFRKHKLYGLVNLLGLSVGLCAFMYITIYLTHEFSYEKEHEFSKDIYRFTFINGTGKQFAICPSGLYKHVKDELPEVKESVRLLRPYTGLATVPVKHESTVHYEQNIVYADSTFTKIFTLNFVEGDERGLRQPNGVLISSTIAQKFFGNGSPVGKSLQLNNEQEVFVSGVFRDLANTHLKIDFLLPFHALTDEQDSWRFWDTNTYFLLHDQATSGTVAAKIDGLIKRHAGTFYNDLWNGFTYVLQPIAEIHFTPNIQFDPATPVDKTKLYIIGTIALAILLMSVINFVNLVTVKLTERGKEVGVSKVLGASESALLKQHIGESIMTSLCAGIVAYAMVVAGSSMFHQITQVKIDFTVIRQVEVIGQLVLAALVIGLLAGIYPASLVKRFKPALVLKNSHSAMPGNKGLRQALVIVQFATTVLLLSAAGIVQRQLGYMQRKDPGFQKEDIVVLPLRDFDKQAYATMKNSLAKHSAIQSVGGSSRPLGAQFGAWGFNPGGLEPGDSRGVANVLIVDFDFITTMDMKMVEGRTFSEEISGDSCDSFVINESAVRWFGLENPIGAQLNTDEIQGKIVGVVKDFNFQSLENVVAPLVMTLRSLNVFDPPDNSYQYMAMRVKPGNMLEVLQFAEAEWKKIRPEMPFQYFFQDEYFGRLHYEQEQLMQIVSIFTAIAVSIGCFGLFALTTYISKRRRKEISIRKVLGGSLVQMVYTLSSEALALVVISLIIALPLSALLTQKWLQSFAFHIEANVGYFILIGVIVVVLAWITVAYESIRTSLINPAKVLKEE